MIATRIPTAPETPQAPVPAVPPYAEPQPGDSWKLARETLKGRRAFWKRQREWLARVAAAWAAVPIQKMARLEVEELVIRPYGAKGSIEIGAHRGADEHGVGEPSLIFKDAQGHPRILIDIVGESASITFRAPAASGDYPSNRAHLGVFGSNVIFSAQDVEGNTLFRLGAPGYDLSSEASWAPADGDTPELATHKAEMRAFVAKQNEEQRQARVDARRYWRARLLSGLDME